MGLLDKFRAKKSKQPNKSKLNITEFKVLYDKTTSAMGCNTDAMTPIDTLAVQAFICATLKRESEYICFNRVCCIDTTIFTCYRLLTQCTIEIENEEFADKFYDEFLNKFILAISDHFHLSQAYTLGIIENRFKIYNEALYSNSDMGDVIFEYKQILLSDVDMKTPCYFDETTPLVISGFDNDIMCQMEIASYNKLLATSCGNLISDVISYCNN